MIDFGNGQFSNFRAREFIIVGYIVQEIDKKNFDFEGNVWIKSSRFPLVSFLWNDRAFEFRGIYETLIDRFLKYTCFGKMC